MPGSRRALFAGATVRPVAPIFPLTEELIFPEGVSGQGTEGQCDGRSECTGTRVPAGVPVEGRVHVTLAPTGRGGFHNQRAGWGRGEGKAG